MTDHHDKIIGDAVNVCPPPDAKRRHGTDHCTTVQRSVHRDDVMVARLAVAPRARVPEDTTTTSDTVVSTTVDTKIDLLNPKQKKKVSFEGHLLPLKTPELQKHQPLIKTMTNPPSKTPPTPRNRSAYVRPSKLLTFEPGPEDFVIPIEMGVYNMPETHPGMYHVSPTGRRTLFPSDSSAQGSDKKIATATAKKKNSIKSKGKNNTTESDAAAIDAAIKENEKELFRQIKRMADTKNKKNKRNKNKKPKMNGNNNNKGNNHKNGNNNNNNGNNNSNNNNNSRNNNSNNNNNSDGNKKPKDANLKDNRDYDTEQAELGESAGNAVVLDPNMSHRRSDDGTENPDWLEADSIEPLAQSDIYSPISYTNYETTSPAYPDLLPDFIACNPDNNDEIEGYYYHGDSNNKLINTNNPRGTSPNATNRQQSDFELRGVHQHGRPRLFATFGAPRGTKRFIHFSGNQILNSRAINRPWWPQNKKVEVVVNPMLRFRTNPDYEVKNHEMKAARDLRGYNRRLIPAHKSTHDEHLVNCSIFNGRRMLRQIRGHSFPFKASSRSQFKNGQNRIECCREREATATGHGGGHRRPHGNTEFSEKAAHHAGTTGHERSTYTHTDQNSREFPSKHFITGATNDVRAGHLAGNVIKPLATWPANVRTLQRAFYATMSVTDASSSPKSDRVNSSPFSLPHNRGHTEHEEIVKDTTNGTKIDSTKKTKNENDQNHGMPDNSTPSDDRAENNSLRSQDIPDNGTTRPPTSKNTVRQTNKPDGLLQRPANPASNDPRNDSSVDDDNDDDDNDDDANDILIELPEPNRNDDESDSREFYFQHFQFPGQDNKDPVWVDNPIAITDIPICHRLADYGIACFSIAYIRAPSQIQRCLSDLNTFYLDDTLEGVLTAIHHGNYHPTDSPIANNMNYVLNLATKWILIHLSPREASVFDRDEEPETFWDRLKARATHNYLAYACTCGLTNGLKTVYLDHERNYSKRPRSEVALLYYAKNIVDVIREIFITATSLSLFKDNSCFAVTPWFLDALSKTSTSCQELSSFLMIIILSMILKAMFFTLTLNFDAFRSTLTSMLTTFTYLQSTTLTNGPEHLNILSNRQYFTMDGCIQKKLTPKMKEPPFLPDQILIGNLPQTDLFFSHFCSAFPMLTSPTHQKQQANTIPPRPQSVLAVNFAMCKPFGLDTSVAYHDDKITTEIKHDGYSFHSKQLYQPDPTDSLNFSMDFLPPLEYLMFKVVQFVHKNNPLNRLYRHQSPMKVIVFQGTPLHCPYYSPASPTECSHHEEKVHTFPITYTKEGFQHNNHHLTNEAYDITTVQLLFKQPCISMRECFLENPEMAPIDSNDKRFHPYSATHHVAIDPRCVPFGPAFCMIEAFIISSWTLHVYEAWARSHAEDALQSIHQIPHLNDYSYFHRHRCEHPPYKYTTKHETPPVSNDGTGELLLDDLTLVDAIVTGNLSASSSRDSGLNLSERENDKFNTVNRYFQQTPTSFSGQHLFAFLAVQTQRPSLCPSNPAPDDPPIGIEQPHASETTSSSSVTTESDDQTHILLLPPTTAQLSSSQTTESYTEPAHNEPNEEEQQEEEQLTTQPLTLQQISLAVSQIVTPKPIPHSPPKPTSTSSSTTSSIFSTAATCTSYEY